MGQGIVNLSVFLCIGFLRELKSGCMVSAEVAGGPRAHEMD